MSSRPPYFTIASASGGFRARLFGGNGELVWMTEVYVSKEGAKNAIRIAKASSSYQVYDRS